MGPGVVGTAPHHGRHVRQRGQEVVGEGGELTGSLGRANTSASSSQREACYGARRKMYMVGQLHMVGPSVELPMGPRSAAL
eukprot:68473-Pyramimonas_sp.AAC.1